MASLEDAKYSKLEAGIDDSNNAPLNDQQDHTAHLLWQRSDPSTKLGFALRIVLGFFMILTLLNIGFLLGDRLVGGTCNAQPTTSTSSEDRIWRDSLRGLTILKPKRFDATLYKRNKYRGPPSPQIDEEWDRFTTNPWMVETAAVLNVSRTEIFRSGNTAAMETMVELDRENGGGYMATLEMFHQLHCLNVLRKWTYWDHYVDTDPFFQTRADHRREHADHCIDVLRQALMCKGDLGLIMFHWIKGIQVPSPDFNTLHQCRDPEAVLAWALENKAPVQHTIERTVDATEAEHPF